MSSDSSSVSWSSLFRGPRAAYTVLLNLAVAVHAVDVFIITTVLPSVITDIGGAAFYAWSTMLYVVVSIIGTAAGNPVKARLGNRGAYISGALVFLLGSIGCAIANSMTVLLFARAAQGLGGGLLLALSHGMVSALYPAALRARVFASISGVWGIAALLGPTVGGVFAQIGWWRGAFWMSVPVSAALIGLGWLFLPAHGTQSTANRLPWLRLFLLGSGVLCVALGGHVGSALNRLLMICLACILVYNTFRLDIRSDERLMPSQPLSLSNRVGTTYWMLFLLGIMTSQFGVFMPLVVQVLHGVTPLGAGYFAALRSMAWTAAALCTAGLRGRAVHTAICAGPLLILGGSIGQALVVVDGPLLWLALYILLTGAGIGICFAHLNTAAISGAQPGEENLTASAIPTVRSLGFSFGAALAGVIANTVGFTDVATPDVVAHVATWVYGLCIVPPALVVMLAMRLVWLQRLGPAGVS